ncbi:hypothetical protein ACB092_03G058200, partial [Castanea dentata]
KASSSNVTLCRQSQAHIPAHLHKGSATNLHVANVHTSLLQVPFLVNLQGKFLWVNCDQQYLTSTYHAPYCHSTQCSKANSHTCHTCPYTARPGCHNNTAMGELAQDELLIQSTQGSNPGPMARVPQFLFTCAPSFLLQKGLPKNVRGVIGLGHAPISVPIQLASHFGFQPKFALCLTSSTRSIDISRPLSYSPLTVSQKGEYYIQVSSIKVNNKLVPLYTSLLSFKQHGLGGAMISTTTPYTILEHSIFTTVTQFFSKELSGVPNVDLVLHTQNVIWRIVGANLMVQAQPGVTCLGFVDGGSHPKASIVIGAYQLEDNLLQFNLAKSRLGSSSSLKSRRTNCANFNFTSSP